MAFRETRNCRSQIAPAIRRGQRGVAFPCGHQDACDALPPRLLQPSTNDVQAPLPDRVVRGLHAGLVAGAGADPADLGGQERAGRQAFRGREQRRARHQHRAAFGRWRLEQSLYAIQRRPVRRSAQQQRRRQPDATGRPGGGQSDAGPSARGHDPQPGHCAESVATARYAGSGRQSRQRHRRQPRGHHVQWLRVPECRPGHADHRQTARRAGRRHRL